jgi:hypothetical protein
MLNTVIEFDDERHMEFVRRLELLVTEIGAV